MCSKCSKGIVLMGYMGSCAQNLYNPAEQNPWNRWNPLEPLEPLEVSLPSTPKLPPRGW
jgi:hypothetical protein